LALLPAVTPSLNTTMAEYEHRSKRPAQTLPTPLRNVGRHAVRLTFVALIVVTLLAQFITPVRDLVYDGRYVGIALVLGSLLLSIEGRSHPAPHSSKDNSLVLDHFDDIRYHLEPAFSSGIVELDVVAYSSETVYHALTDYFQDIISGRMPLRRLRIRLLLPDCYSPMAIPCRVDSLEEDATYKLAVQGRYKNYVTEFQSHITQIRENCQIDDVDLQVRIHQLSPLFKAIFVNGQVAFFGLYPIAETPVGDDRTAVWDYRGERTRMIRVGTSGTATEKALNDSLRSWFDSVWSDIAQIAN
jgi:hypothetical protein